MKFKYWTKSTLKISILLFLILLIINYIVNPNMKFDNKSLKNNYFSTIEYAKKLKIKLSDDKYTLIFGTSRSALVSNDTLNSEVLNIGVIYGSPHSVYTFLSSLTKKEISNIKEIYYLVDLHTLNSNSKFVKNDDFMSDDSFIQSIKNLISINFQDLYRIYLKLKFTLFGSEYIVHENGYSVKKDSDIMALPKFNVSTDQKYDDSALEKLKIINDFCIKNNLKITYYTATFIDEWLSKQVDPNIIIERWSKILDLGIKGFYGLWYIPEVSSINKEGKYNFSDYSHMNYNTLKYVYENYILNENKKYYIENKEELIKTITDIDNKIGGFEKYNLINAYNIQKVNNEQK